MTTMTNDLSPSARDFFAAGYELRMKDIDPGSRLVTRDANAATCLHRSIHADSNWTSIEVKFENGVVKTYYGHATSTLPFSYA